MNVSRLRHVRFWLFAGLLIFLGPLGCSDSTPPPSGKPAAQTDTQPQGASNPERETWDIIYIQGSRVGYGRMAIRPTTRSGRSALKIEGFDHLSIKRFGQQTELEIRATSIETSDGKLIEFQSEIGQGSNSVRTAGQVVGDRLELDTTTRGKRTSTSIPWSAEYGGPFATEQSLLRNPMQPGQRRTVRFVDPTLSDVATCEMTAKGRERVRLLRGTYDLLRIDIATRLPDGQTLPGTVWCDRTGETLKVRMEMMGMAMERFRAERAMALEKTAPGELDLSIVTAVKVSRSLPRAHETKRIRYRVQLEEGDPAGAFVSSASQQIKSIDPHTAELTVYALRPGRAAGNESAVADPPTDDDRQPNNWIQSDYPKIVEMARKAVGDKKDPWQVALALERYVDGYITEVAFSEALATAADVAENRVGDCTEHAVLLAALARARGIPARAAMGLVYMQGKGSFGYHMWTEVYVEGRWIPLDATLGRGGIGAAHLKVAHGNFKGATAYSSFLPVIRVIGRLKIEVLEVE